MMKQAARYKMALTSLFGCLVLSACGETAKAESMSIDRITQALAAEKKLSICTGGRKAAAPDAASKTPSQMDHSHIPIAVPETAPKPHMSIALTRDVMSGYNLQIHTANYDMSPPPIGVPMEAFLDPRVSPASGFVQGHAHLYINGEKVQRVYGNHIHLPASHFKTGINQLNVTLNNHAHMFWTADEKQIISSVFINTEVPKLIVHQFDSLPLESKNN